MAISDDRLLRIQSNITARDYRLLDWLYDHGTLTTDQIARALFPSLDFRQRRLLKLTNLHAVQRFRPQKPDGGSYPYHYVLSQLGTEYIAGQRQGEPPRRDAARRRIAHLTSRANLPHLLGTNGVFIDLAAHQRTHPGTRLDVWRPASAFKEKGAFYREGSDMQMVLARLPTPDGHGVWIEHGQAVPFLLEYDLGIENLGILYDKVDRYALMGVLAQHWTWPVLFHLPSVRRETNLHRLIASYGRTRALVATTAVDYLNQTRQTVAEAVWWLQSDPGPRRRLSELPYRDPQHDEHYHLSADPDDEEHPTGHLGPQR